MTYEELERMSPQQRGLFVRDLERQLFEIEQKRAQVARELREVEKDRREYLAQQAYWTAKYGHLLP